MLKSKFISAIFRELEHTQEYALGCINSNPQELLDDYIKISNSLERIRGFLGLLEEEIKKDGNGDI